MLKIIAGLVRPTEGTVCLEKGKLIHYVPEHFPQMNLTAMGYLLYMGKMEILESVTLRTHIYQLAEEFFVSNMLDIPMKYLSKGSLQKIGVIQALLKEPDILVLDEPLSGQDMMSQQVFIQRMQELRKHNVTILMACQSVEPEVSEQIIILRMQSERKYYIGQVLFLGTLSGIAAVTCLCCPIIVHYWCGKMLFTRNIHLSDLVGGLLLMFACSFLGTYE